MFRHRGGKLITVAIVDDHPVVRAGMRAVLEAAPDIKIVAEGSDGAGALRLVAEHKPDVLVLDLNLPDRSGLDVAQELCKQEVDTAILILTAHHDSQMVFGLLERGAIGYVLKDEALEMLVNAVRAAARGESWLSPSVARDVVRRAIGKTPVVPPHPSFPDLTPAELQVLRLLAQGLDNTAIAQQLVVTKRTVQNHVSNIYGKLGVNSRTEAMLYALQQGLVQLPPAADASDEF
jgi:DNA-binding NarL/FixJ family response regulator